MPIVDLVPARPAHVGTIAHRMRAWDRIEVEAAGKSPRRALRLAMRDSLWTLTAVIDGKPEAMFGVVPVSLVESLGVPWFLGTERIYDQGRSMLTKGRDVIAHMRRTFSHLENVVAADNARAIRMLRAWGFSVGDQREWHGGVAFVRFGWAS